MKLSHTNLKKMIDTCTGKQMNFMVYLAQLQDKYGIIRGIRYDETMEKAVIGKCTFYVSLDALCKKGLLEVLPNSDDDGKSYWTIRIVDNVFKIDEDYKKGYINLNQKIFNSNFFKKSPKNIKIIIFNLFLIRNFKNNTIKITRETLKKWTKATDRSVRTYIHILANWFNIKKDNNLLVIDCYQGFETTHMSEQKIKDIHLINYRLKKSKCQAEYKDITDVCKLMQNFYMYGLKKIFSAIDTSLNMFGTLQPSFINKRIRE